MTHMSFGAVIHMCVGNRLARGELRLAFQALTSRGDGSIVSLVGYTLYDPRSLWMKYDRRGH